MVTSKQSIHYPIVMALGLLSMTASFAEDWPQFRGPDRDGRSSETDMLREWPEGGPEILWSTPLGPGYSSAAIHGGKVFFNDYDESTSEFLVRCLTLEEGKELWRFKETRRIRPNHAITRSVPATDGKLVFSLDPKTTLHAIDAETGKEVWRKNFVQEYGTKIPPWYNGQNPLIEDDKLIVAPAGTSALVVALNKATGEELWRTPNPDGWLLSHASPMPAKLGGVDQYLFSVLQGTVGISAADGTLLWHHPFKFNVSVSPSPLVIDSERVYVTAAYDSGGVMFRVTLSSPTHRRPGTPRSRLRSCSMGTCSPWGRSGGACSPVSISTASRSGRATDNPTLDWVPSFSPTACSSSSKARQECSACSRPTRRSTGSWPARRFSPDTTFGDRWRCPKASS
jgi:outer membrane protein assembly factor BamB